jgi:predicted AlkP superfamily pyrophosphatase or phosphodiesterase
MIEGKQGGANGAADENIFEGRRLNDAGRLLALLTVGMTRRLLPFAPRFSRLAQQGAAVGLREVSPAVTCTAQASMLTGVTPQVHGVVANGWFERESAEVRFWRQSNRLIGAEPIYQSVRARRAEQGRAFHCAKLFWWFNQGADVELAITPKPHYGCDGDKRFDVEVAPRSRRSTFDRLGPFPFPSFWGPNAGLPSTRWIAESARLTIETGIEKCDAAGSDLVGNRGVDDRYDLVLVYLPHLDYDPQRFGPSGCDMKAKVAELDRICEPLLDSAERLGYRVWLVSEYGHCDVVRPIYLNRLLRRAGLLDVKDGPFGETIDFFSSRAFAVCDHQMAHLYVRRKEDVGRVVDSLGAENAFAKAYVGEGRGEIGLNHPNAGDVVVMSANDAWFAYQYWLDDSRCPDFARCVDIHRKPGFDPCEMFFDPRLSAPKLRVGWRLIQKKLGFRSRFDVVPLDASIVRGSHGNPAVDPLDRPLFVTDDPADRTLDGDLTLVHRRLTEELMK